MRQAGSISPDQMIDLKIKIQYYHIAFVLCFPILQVVTAAAQQEQQNLQPAANHISIPPSIQSSIDSLKTLLRVEQTPADKIRLYGKICWTYLSVPRLDLARRYADSVSVIAKQTNDSSGIMKEIYYSGVIARLKGDYNEAAKYIEKHIAYYERKGDSARVAGSLYQAGTIQSHLGNYDKSLAAFYRLIPIEQKDGNDYSVGYTLNAIGTILFETKKYREAEPTFKKALYIFDTLDEKRDKTDVLVNLGNLYTATGELQKASDSYRQALIIDRKTGKQTGVASSLANLGFLYDKMELYDSALVFHLQALAIRATLPSKEDLARSLIGVGLGYQRLNKYDSAKYYFLKVLPLITEMGSKPMLLDVYENLGELYASEKNFENAYRYRVLYSKMKDSVLSETTAKQLNELQTKYETGEKDKQIALLAQEKLIRQKESQRQAVIKNALIGGLILLSLLVILLGYIFRQRLKNQKLITLKNQEIREANFRRELSDLEMKALRAQINPHFLFNCMNALNRMILSGEMENASYYLSRFSKLVRLILENAEAPTVSLDNELALLESYIQLEELRFKGKINYHISVDESIPRDQTYLPSMVLQPFVENAIWHGLMHKETTAKGHISIDVKEAGDTLLCTIEDNGVGREKAKELKQQSILKSKSMGIRITEERLKLLSQRKEQNVIQITDLKDHNQTPVGTRVEINIPIS